jgi:acyl-CoA-binding protein
MATTSDTKAYETGGNNDLKSIFKEYKSKHETLERELLDRKNPLLLETDREKIFMYRNQWLFGDYSKTKPEEVKPEEKKKWETLSKECNWKELKGISKESAKEGYIMRIEDLKIGAEELKLHSVPFLKRLDVNMGLVSGLTSAGLLAAQSISSSTASTTASALAAALTGASTVSAAMSSATNHQANHDQHALAQSLSSKLQREAMALEKKLHLQSILSDLREHDKEADRDLWEQSTDRYTLLMTVSSLLLAGGFALAVEGNLPEEPGMISIFEVGVLYHFFLAAGFGFHFCVIFGCMKLTSRLREFMEERIYGQAEINKEVRRAAVQLMCEPDCAAAHEEALHYALRKQFVVETCTREQNRRHVWGFKDWYSEHCKTLDSYVYVCNTCGTVAMMLAVVGYMYAHLVPDNENELHSETAFKWFFYTLGALLVVGCVFPWIVGSTTLDRMWRDNCGGGESNASTSNVSGLDRKDFDAHHVYNVVLELAGVDDERDGNSDIEKSDLEIWEKKSNWDENIKKRATAGKKVDLIISATGQERDIIISIIKRCFRDKEKEKEKEKDRKDKWTKEEWRKAIIKYAF